MEAFNAVGMEAVIISNVAAALHGVPVTTQDIDLFMHDTPPNMENIAKLVRTLGDHVVATRPFEPVTCVI